MGQLVGSKTVVKSLESIWSGPIFKVVQRDTCHAILAAQVLMTLDGFIP